VKPTGADLVFCLVFDFYDYVLCSVQFNIEEE